MTGLVSRRAVVKALVLTSATTILAAKRSAADQPARLSVKDPAAVKLGYVEDASQVDTRKFPSYVPGSTCENCLLLQGKSGDAFRPCTLFTGKVVSAKGWCSGWAAEI